MYESIIVSVNCINSPNHPLYYSILLQQMIIFLLQGAYVLINRNKHKGDLPRYGLSLAQLVTNYVPTLEMHEIKKPRSRKALQKVSSEV